jgi:Flp pilus assembly protein TadG
MNNSNAVASDLSPTTSTTAGRLKSPPLSRRKRRIRAQSTVELALVFPLVWLLLMAIVEFGWLIKNTMTMTNAARETARSAALGNPQSVIFTQATNTATPLALSSVAMTYSTNNGTSWQPFPTDSNGQNGVPSGNLIKVTLTANNIQLVNFIPQLNNFVINQNVIMTRE